MECLSCGLWLDAGLPRCPGCGTDQVLKVASDQQAACTVHAPDAASFTCRRCGRFGCARCNLDGLGVCAECVERVRVAHVARRARLRRLMLGALAVSALSGPAVTWRVSPGPFLTVMAIGAAIQLFSLARQLWRPEHQGVLGVAFAGLAGIPLLGMLGSTPWALVPLAAFGISAWCVTRIDVLDREIWRAAQRPSTAV